MNETAPRPSEKLRSVAFTDSRPTITIDGELSPLERRGFTGIKGGQLEYDVLAQFTTPNDNRSIVICAKQELVGAIVVEDGNQIIEGNTLESGKERWVKVSPDGMSSIRIEHTVDEHKKPHWEFTYAGSQPKTSMTINDDRSLAVKSRKYDYVERRKKSRKVAIRVAGVAALFATLAPNGPIDWAVDAANGVNEFVASASVVGNAVESKNEDHEKATESVAQLLQAIDDGNADSVKRQGEAFARQDGNFVSNEVAIGIQNEITTATSADEILAAMNELSPAINVTFGQGDYNGFTELPTLEEVRYTAGQIVQEITQTPLKLFNTELRHVTLTGHHKNRKTVLGMTSGDDVGIVCDTKDSEAKSIAINNIGDPFGMNTSVVSRWRHEFAHTREHMRGMQAVGDTSLKPVQDDTELALRSIGAVPLLIFNHQPAVSTYAMSDRYESAAESFAVAQGLHQRDYANPNNGRKFYSGANKLVVANLILMEEIQPGIAAYYLSR